MGNYYKISWERYVIQLLIYWVVVSLILATKSFLGWFAILLVIIWTVWIAIQILENYVLKVFIDEQGVWISSGLFPWNKGIYGLNWRDISGAVYRTGFMSWMLKSYTVTVQHRYTRENHLILPHLAHGNLLVQEINDGIASKDLY